MFPGLTQGQKKEARQSAGEHTSDGPDWSDPTLPLTRLSAGLHGSLYFLSSCSCSFKCSRLVRPLNCSHHCWSILAPPISLSLSYVLGTASEKSAASLDSSLLVLRTPAPASPRSLSIYGKHGLCSLSFQPFFCPGQAPLNSTHGPRTFKKSQSVGCYCFSEVPLLQQVTCYKRCISRDNSGYLHSRSGILGCNQSR